MAADAGFVSVVAGACNRLDLLLSASIYPSGIDAIGR